MRTDGERVYSTYSGGRAEEKENAGGKSIRRVFEVFRANRLFCIRNFNAVSDDEADFRFLYGTCLCV